MVFGGNGGDQSLPTEYKGGMRKEGGGEEPCWVRFG